LSFTPFLGGKRICAGKTFADLVLKQCISLFVMTFDIDFVDKIHYEKMFPVGIFNLDREILVRLKTF
jgi:cytochrome P450